MNCDPGVLLRRCKDAEVLESENSVLEHSKTNEQTKAKQINDWQSVYIPSSGLFGEWRAGGQL